MYGWMDVRHCREGKNAPTRSRYVPPACTKDTDGNSFGGACILYQEPLVVGFHRGAFAGSRLYTYVAGTILYTCCYGGADATYIPWCHIHPMMPHTSHDASHDATYITFVFVVQTITFILVVQHIYIGPPNGDSCYTLHAFLHCMLSSILSILLSRETYGIYMSYLYLHIWIHTTPITIYIYILTYIYIYMYVYIHNSSILVVNKPLMPLQHTKHKHNE